METKARLLEKRIISLMWVGMEVGFGTHDEIKVTHPAQGPDNYAVNGVPMSFEQVLVELAQWEYRNGRLERVA